MSYYLYREFEKKLNDHVHTLIHDMETRFNAMFDNLSGVDKETLSNLRSIMTDYYGAKSYIRALAQEEIRAIEKELSGFAEKVEEATAPIQESILDAIRSHALATITDFSNRMDSAVSEKETEFNGELTELFETFKSNVNTYINSDEFREDIRDIVSEMGGVTVAPKTPVVLADVSISQPAATYVLPLSDNARNYRKLLLKLSIKHSESATVPSASLYSTEQETSYGTLCYLQGMFDTTSVRTVYVTVEFFDSMTIVRGFKKDTEEWFMDSYSISTNAKTATINAIRFSGIKLAAGSSMKVEGLPV